ncbi:related to Cytochrome P450 8B1 [Sporisorium reilianum SRZ2]|uniref:Related to Cytochrome P450 8B1 n=1 Tax=Sporisorium reilianum (strain SRZ2) TaxID=999809 RepID=E6ZPM2_SPORE|nr:related to Cytochrome P450 8B1 [Sporisorium reilianum SRZ2]
MFQFQLSTDPSTLVLTSLVLLLVTAYLLHSRPSSPPRPARPPLAHPFPLVPPHSRNLLLAHRSQHGTVFRTASPNTVYISDALAIKHILDHPALFSVSALHISSAAMWSMSPACAEWFAREGGEVTLRLAARLFSGEWLAALQVRFVDAAARGMDGVQMGRVEVMEVVAGAFFGATMEALFTPGFDDGLWGVFRMWDAQLHAFCAGTPSADAIEARDRFYGIVEHQLHEHLDECSPQIQHLFRSLCDDHAQTHADAIAIVLRTAWLACTQSPLAAAWLLCILAHHPPKLQRVREEFEHLKHEMHLQNTQEAVERVELLKAERLPALDRLVNEVLRVYCAQTVPRVCMEDTVVRAMDGGGVREWQMERGDVVNLLYWCVHDSRLNPQVSETFRGTLQPFDEERFAPDRHSAHTVKLGGTNETVRTWTPFGYGTRMCPGRYWAVAEIKAFVLLFLDRFDLAQPEEMPRPDPERWFGVLSPLDAMPVNLTLRS